ncbi:hypothetical protein K456DRAFT_53577 [Colletotrichum gloeosporioides 23]|nr:hypothetical protein K456DRAFT_53577 [Colletotrichum gloeosporioides 23]
MTHGHFHPTTTNLNIFIISLSIPLNFYINIIFQLIKQYTEVDVSQALEAMANGQSLKKASLESAE